MASIVQFNVTQFDDLKKLHYTYNSVEIGGIIVRRLKNIYNLHDVFCIMQGGI